MKKGEKKEVVKEEVKFEVLPEIKEPVEIVQDISGLNPKEVEMGKKVGVIKEKKEAPEVKDEPTTDAPKTETVDNQDKVVEPVKKEAEPTKEVKEDIKAEINKDKTPEEEHGFVAKLNPKERAFYFEMKENKRKRQSAQSERDFMKVKLAAMEKELEELKAKPKLDEFGEPAKEDYVTKEELAKIEKEKADKEAQAKALMDKNSVLEQEARLKDEDFDNVAIAAREVMDKDSSGVFAAKFVKIFADPDNDNETIIDYIYKLAKMGGYKKEEPKEEPKPEVKPEEKKKVEKMLENAHKVSSASISGGTVRFKSESELTLADVAKWPQEKWNSLKRETKDRILKESCG